MEKFLEFIFCWQGLYCFCLGVLGMMTGNILSRLIILKTEQIKKVSRFPKCTCSDPNQCETWCMAKDLFTQDNCPHRDVRISVIHSSVGCETTIDICDTCNKILSEPKTECI